MCSSPYLECRTRTKSGTFPSLDSLCAPDDTYRAVSSSADSPIFQYSASDTTDSVGLLLPPLGREGRSLIQVAIRNDELSTTGFLEDLFLYDDVELTLEMEADFVSLLRASSTIAMTINNRRNNPAPAPPAMVTTSNFEVLVSSPYSPRKPDEFPFGGAVEKFRAGNKALKLTCVEVVMSSLASGVENDVIFFSITGLSVESTFEYLVSPGMTMTVVEDADIVRFEPVEDFLL